MSSQDKTTRWITVETVMYHQYNSGSVGTAPMYGELTFKIDDLIAFGKYLDQDRLYEITLRRPDNSTYTIEISGQSYDRVLEYMHMDRLTRIVRLGDGD